MEENQAVLLNLQFLSPSSTSRSSDPRIPVHIKNCWWTLKLMCIRFTSWFLFTFCFIKISTQEAWQPSTKIYYHFSRSLWLVRVEWLDRMFGNLWERSSSQNTMLPQRIARKATMCWKRPWSKLLVCVHCTMVTSVLYAFAAPRLTMSWNEKLWIYGRK